jgi:ribose 5-phosphate isomerase A
VTERTAPTAEDLDRVAARALDEVRDGMRVGLGTGRAAEAFIVRLGARVREGLNVVAVATSERSDALARQVGIKTTTLAGVDSLDVAFDGADEVAPDLSLVKGLGGAALRERVVARESSRFVVLVTPEKLVSKLGERAPIPVEVVPFAVGPAQRRLALLAPTTAVTRRIVKGGTEPFVTDNGNAILDVAITPTDKPGEVDAVFRAIAGVVDVGFFLGMVDLVLIGERGSVRELKSPRAFVTTRLGKRK